MRVAVSGSHGLIGTAVARALAARGDEVQPIARDSAGELITSGLAGVDAVVHLAGEGVAEKRWSDAQKTKVLESRSRGTAALANALAALDVRPRVLVSGSAIGYYGTRGDEVLTESSASGDDFLSEVCRAWEAATAPAEAAGIRVAHIRTGIVLDRTGGALKKQLPLFRMGVGGKLASGRQWMSWIAIDDEVGAILHLIDTATVSGPVNLTAPNPVTNATFTKALGHALHRPAVLPVPSLALKIVLGAELADNLLGSQRVQPAKLLAGGYDFRYPDIDGALAAVLQS
jgi:uncharacterized protein